MRSSVAPGLLVIFNHNAYHGKRDLQGMKPKGWGAVPLAVMSRRSLFPAPVPAVSTSDFASFRAPKFYSFLGLILLVLIVASAWRTIDSSLVLMNLKAGERI